MAVITVSPAIGKFSGKIGSCKFEDSPDFVSLIGLILIGLAYTLILFFASVRWKNGAFHINIYAGQKNNKGIVITQSQLFAWKELGSLFVMSKPSHQRYTLTWRIMFGKINSYYWNMHGTYRANPPDIIYNNVRSITNCNMSSDIASKELIFRAEYFHQMPRWIFLYISPMISKGSCVCHQFSGIMKVPFLSDLNVNIWDLYQEKYPIPLRAGVKLFYKIVLVSTDTGFVSLPVFNSVILI
jgi:hypothetical protein